MIIARNRGGCMGLCVGRGRRHFSGPRCSPPSESGGCSLTRSFNARAAAAVCATDGPRPPRISLPRKLSLSHPPPPLQNSSVPQAGSRSTSSLIPTFLPPLPLPSFTAIGALTTSHCHHGKKNSVYRLKSVYQPSVHRARSSYVSLFQPAKGSGSK